MSKILNDAEAIRVWAEARGGNPMLMDVPEPSGNDRVLLQITFGQHALNADGNEGPDRQTGFRLVSWDEWFAELDKQGLMLKVKDDGDGVLSNDYEYVGADGEREVSPAAEKPPAMVTEQPYERSNHAERG